jgi:acetyl-CoA synthetase
MEKRYQEGSAPRKWFVGGKLNISENCLIGSNGPAPEQGGNYLEGEPGKRTLTYRSCITGSPLRSVKRNKVRKGDCHYLSPDIPEAAVHAGLRPHRQCIGDFWGI